MRSCSVTLYRICPEQNMQRWYHLNIQPDLFGNSCVVKEWGRLGRSGQVRITPYSTEDEAQTAFYKQQRAKERKGYVCRPH
jgi:predicted DNA-binding WGR domain protein